MVVLVGSCVCDKAWEGAGVLCLMCIVVMALYRRKPGKELRAGTQRLELRRNHGETLLTLLLLLGLFFFFFLQPRTPSLRVALPHHSSIKILPFEFGSHWVTSSCNSRPWGSDIFFQSLWVPTHTSHTHMQTLVCTHTNALNKNALTHLYKHINKII